MQYVFVNGRFVRDRSLQHALREAYRGLILGNRFPIAFINFSMPPERVDVNVHPTKIEVRFQDPGRHYGQLLSTLRTKFLSTDLHARVRGEENDDPAIAHDEGEAARLRRELVDWAKGEVEAMRGRSDALELNRLERPWTPAHRGGSPPQSAAPAEAENRLDGRHVESQGHHFEATASQKREGNAAAGQTQKAVQAHNRYILAESEDGVMIVDQHALHERILYEQLRGRIGAGTLETQKLLVPEAVDLTPTEAATALQNRELLARLGMNVEPFGGDTVLVTGFPAMLANFNPGDVLRALLERIMTGGGRPEAVDILDELLHEIACKAAVKAGDRLSADELTALLEQRHLVDNPHHCPHGRPAVLIFSKEELDKRFKRV
jgi:DNA mismatch repair protein MutL